MGAEGREVAEWLAERGIAAFVLKYRLLDTGATEEQFRVAVKAMHKGPSDEKAAQAADAERRILRLAGADGLAAMKYVKEHAEEFQVDAGRVGFMGFSAGGAVANQVLFEYTAETRPAFAAPIYAPVFGDLTVSQDAPPIFLLCADDDNAVDPMGSVKMYLAWHVAGKSAELRIYRNGGHAFGMTRKSNATDGWIERYYEWLRGQGFLESPRSQSSPPPPSAINGQKGARRLPHPEKDPKCDTGIEPDTGRNLTGQPHPRTVLIAAKTVDDSSLLRFHAQAFDVHTVRCVGVILMVSGSPAG